MDFSCSHFPWLVIVAALSYFLAKQYPNDNAKEEDENPAKPALRVLYEKPSENGPDIDIIAVHGLGSNAEYAWSYTTGSRSVNWLADDDMLPSTLSRFNPRILLYSYNSKWHQDAPILRLQECATELFTAINDFRRDNSSSMHRPIVFIGHSLGGNVIINGLVKNQNGELKNLVDLTVGVALLGSPLRGSGMAWLSRLVAWMMSTRGSHGGIIRQLNHGNTNLRDTLTEFQRLSKEIFMPSYCFYEKKLTDYGKKYGMPGIIRGMVVNEESACIDDQKHGLDTDHLGLNKYSGPEDPSFVRVSGEITRICQNSKDLLKRRKNSPKAHFMVRFNQNMHFTGRESIMEQLSPRLLASTTKQGYQRTALVGLGGVGKTQIALEAAWRVHKEDPECSIFWVSAVDTTSFDNGYRSIGELLNIDGIEQEGADIKLLVQKALEKSETGRWLLVIDNADDSDIFFDPNPPLDRSTGLSLASYLPSCELGCILFTTRDLKAAAKLTKGNVSIIRVPEMKPTESRQLLLSSLLDEPDERHTASVEKLLELLTHLPLAIKQAGAFMVENNMAVPRYVELFQSTQEKKIKLLSENFEVEGRYENTDNAAMTTWLVSFNQISTKDKLAAEFLKLMSLMSEKDIPSDFLHAAYDDKTSEAVEIEEQKDEIKWRRSEVDDIQVEKSIGTLAAYAFITKTAAEDSYDLHRLVSLSMRNWLQKESVTTMYASQVVMRLNTIFPNPDYKNKEFWLRYLPHTKHVLSWRLQHNGEAAKADLLRHVAWAFHLLGNYGESEKYHERALELIKTLLGNEDVITLKSMDDLGILLHSHGKYDEAERIHRKTLDLREKVLGKEHPETLESMNNLALVLDSQAKYAEAGKIHRQTLELSENLLGKDHPDRLRTMNNLGIVLVKQAKYDEAEKMYRQTLELRLNVLGKEHPASLGSMNNFAIVLVKQAKYYEAEKMCRQTLELSDKLLGKDHPDTLTIMNNLGIVLVKQAKYDEAEKMCRMALELSDKLLGKEHPYTLASMDNLGLVLQSQAKFDEAEKIHRQTLELSENLLGKDHPDTLRVMNNLGIVFVKQAKYDEAEKMYRRTLELREKVLGKEHPDTLGSMNKYGMVLDSQAKNNEAEKIHRQTLELRKKVLGKEHPETLESVDKLERVLHSQGK